MSGLRKFRWQVFLMIGAGDNITLSGSILYNFCLVQFKLMEFLGHLP